MAEEICMSSLPDCVPPPVPLSAPSLHIRTLRPPRTWYFIGTTLFGAGVFGVQQLAQIATLIILFVWSGVELPLTEGQSRDMLNDGRGLAWMVIVSCPFLLAALWLPIRIARQTFSNYLALRWPERSEVMRSLAMLVGLLLFWHLLRFALGQAFPQFMIETYRSARDSGSLVWYLVALCVAAPVAEEFLVRGFLLRGWSQSFLGPLGAVVLSSAVWAAVHTQYNWFYVSEIFALGILLGVLRLRSGSTWLTVILHAANNAIAVVVVAVAMG
jgi:membrane protease YdiL (CAAX protease family)